MDLRPFYGFYYVVMLDFTPYLVINLIISIEIRFVSIVDHSRYQTLN